MFARKELPEYEREIQDILMTIGPGDIMLDDISVSSEGVLSAAFLRGSQRKKVDLPVERLADPEQAGVAVRDAIGDLIDAHPPSEAPPQAVPEARFEDSDRKHRAGTKFDELRASRGGISARALTAAWGSSRSVVRAPPLPTA